jgi:hypothetical protein
MIWIFIIFLVFITSILLYSQRFKERNGLRGKNLVQTYYVFSGLVSGFSLIGIFIDIISRGLKATDGTHTILNVSILLCVLITVIACILHSVSLFFQNPRFNVRFPFKNQIFWNYVHGPVSHYAIYFGGIVVTLLIGILELMYMDSGSQESMIFILFFGIVIGICEALSVIWSQYIFFTLLTASAALLLLIHFLTSYSVLFSHPYTSVSLISLFVMVALLSLFLLVDSFSSKARSLLVFIYPKGHPKRD